MKKSEDKQAPTEEAEQIQGKRKMSPFGHLFRFIGLWFGFTGIYSMFAVCPFCGQQGCPVGLASAGTVGAFFCPLCPRLETFIQVSETKDLKACKREDRF